MDCLFGNILFVFFSFSYFFSANKDVYKIIGMSKEKFDKKKIAKPLNKPIEKDINWKVDNEYYYRPVFARYVEPYSIYYDITRTVCVF